MTDIPQYSSELLVIKNSIKEFEKKNTKLNPDLNTPELNMTHINFYKGFLEHPLR